MKESKQGTLLRVFVGESDRYQGKPVYEAIGEGFVTMEQVQILKYRASA